MDAEYQQFLASKAVRAVDRGLDIGEHGYWIAPHLFPFQRDCVEFGLRAGCSAMFLDTGMGKTEVQLDWCHHAMRATNGRALILTPLAVAGQTKRRADRWGYEARVIRDQSQAGPGINICNYDRLDKLDPSAFGAVSMDEASILKSFTGKTTRALIDAFAGARFKMVATATPAPNDHRELGNYAEFLDVMQENEMMSRFFINDTSTASQQWRLKGHAVSSFWDWVSSWARCASRPSDLTYDPKDDEAFELPEYKVIRHRARDSRIDRDLSTLFGAVDMSATNVHMIKRQTSEARAEVVASIVRAERDEPWIVWVDTDYEADAILKVLPNSPEVRGSHPIERKEETLEYFASGAAVPLIAKPSACGFGLDWSHCARMAFVGRSYSYETWYQAIRRCWRFGQKRTVEVHIVVAEGESEIGRVIDRKAADHAVMQVAMREAMRRSAGITDRRAPYNPTHLGSLPSWIKSAV